MSNTNSAKENWLELATSIGYESETEMWENMYAVEKRTIGEIAKTLGFGTCTIARRIGLCGVTKKTRGGPHSPSKAYEKMFHLDQRFVALATAEEIAKLCGSSVHTIYRIKKES